MEAKTRSLFEAREESPADISWVSVRLVREASAVYRPTAPTRAADVVAIVEPLLEGEPREHFLAVLVDAKGRPNAIHHVSMGGLDHCPAEPREVFQAAILANAGSIIRVHNTPRETQPHPPPTLT